MIYLDSFRFPDDDWEWEQRLKVKRTCYNTMYPFGILSGIGLERLDFAPVTILYGGNGSGKTTALNVIAAKLRDTPGNTSGNTAQFVGSVGDANELCAIALISASVWRRTRCTCWMSRRTA